MHCSEPQLVGGAPLGVDPGEMQRAESALWAQLWALADPGCGHRTSCCTHAKPATVEFGTGLCAHRLGQMIKTFLRGSVLSEMRVPEQWHTHGGRTCVPVTRAGERYLLFCLCC